MIHSVGDLGPVSRHQVDESPCDSAGIVPLMVGIGLGCIATVLGFMAYLWLVPDA